MLSLSEIIKRHEAESANWTREERIAFLQRAKILDEYGRMDERYFSEETIKKDRLLNPDGVLGSKK